jgi:HK97 family phage prohead protease
MPISPGADESQSDWMSRCVPEMMGPPGPDQRDNDQAVAICLDIWREEHPNAAAYRARQKRMKQTGKQIGPDDGESYTEWLDRCVDETGDPDFCQWLWEEMRGGDDTLHARPPAYKGGKPQWRRQAPSPNADEDHDSFMNRCIVAVQEDDDTLSEDDAEQMCEVAWSNGEAHARPAIIKSTAKPVHNFEYTMSDETPDRYGDIVAHDGWVLDHFRNNPVALFGHNHDFPIGRWLDVHIDKEVKALRGRLDIPKGVSPRIDEIRLLVDAGYLPAVSVGFRSLTRPKQIKNEAGDDTGGLHFLRHELLECSVVPVPANPSALAIAKSLRISPDTLKLAFAEPGDRRQLVRRRVLTGEPAARPHGARHKAMSTISERIEVERSVINDLRDRQAEHLRNIDDANPNEAEDAITVNLSRQIGQHVRHLQSLEEAERAQMPVSMGERIGEILPPERDPDEPGSNGRRTPVRGRQLMLAPSPIAFQRADGGIKYRFPPAIIKRRKELDSVDYLIRNGVITLFAHRLKKNPDEIRTMLYGDDERTKACFQYIQKAVSAPAMTDVPTWAEELVIQVQGDFMAPLMPTAIFPQLAALGLSLDFGRAGRIAIPTRLRTRTIAGAFIGEGQPIPVKQGVFSPQIVTPKKLGVITVMTREIEEHSIPAIEALLRDAISEDTGQSIDDVLLDANPATVVRPPGLRNYAPTPLPPTQAGAEPILFNRMVRDLRRLRAELISMTNGNVRAPCWIMNPIRTDGIALNVAPGTDPFPFRAEVYAGSLMGWPLFESTTVNPNQILAVDAADFVTAGQGAPTFEVSDQATLHMEDTEPGPIHGPQPPGGTVGAATPVRSLWQTDSYALRLLYRLNWLMRRPMVTWMQGFLWGGLTPDLPTADEPVA